MAVMQINRKIDYALRAVIYLTCRQSEKPCSVGEIAQNEDVPKKFLEKIIQDLIRCGLVRSHRGPKGGYTLARDPDEVTFKDIVEAVDGPVSLNICVSETGECGMMPTCGMHWVWEEGQRRVMELFANTTLADMRDRHFASAKAPSATEPRRGN